MKFVATDRVIFFSAIICTCLSLPTIPQRTGTVSSRHAKKLVKRSHASDMAEMMLEFGDVDGSGQLTEHETFLFFKNSIGFSDQEAAEVSQKMIEMGDFNKDDKLNYLEAAVALMIISDTWGNALK
ncbi:uncharacterized protein LOC110464847 [Mizuhopecten yessoensis]|uniref:Calmodulin n=1 Tax=Mizuhopecten yessoensis TaxID=6573 RepID=A0A210PSX4_MIZYE|nr:uncharacterized protein LOC110464847 [Mizuhopecten yessoensis]OWF39600.1 hypothetical protein KP79_PYT22181 [Mizuhopecten yessoensis]